MSALAVQSDDAPTRPTSAGAASHVTGCRAVSSWGGEPVPDGEGEVMRVFVAGGTGVSGRRLVPQLVARGHQVTATTTSAGKLGLLARLGADGVVMDGLDAASAAGGRQGWRDGP